MVQRDHDLFRIEYFGKSGLFKDPDGDRCRHIIPEDNIQLCFDQISGMNFRQPRMGSEDLLGHRHSHYASSFAFASYAAIRFIAVR